MLNEDALPGAISIESLAESFGRLAGRSAILRDDVGPALNSQPELVRLLKENPVAAWAGGVNAG